MKENKKCPYWRNCGIPVTMFLKGDKSYEKEYCENENGWKECKFVKSRPKKIEK